MALMAPRISRASVPGSYDGTFGVLGRSWHAVARMIFDIINRLVARIFTATEDTPVPPDYWFSFSLDPQRRAIYELDGRFYPTPPRCVNPWRRDLTGEPIPDLVDELEALVSPEDEFMNRWSDKIFTEID